MLKIDYFNQWNQLNIVTTASNEDYAFNKCDTDSEGILIRVLKECFWA